MNKNVTKVTLNLSSNIVTDGNTNFPHKLLLANTRISVIDEAFANG